MLKPEYQQKLRERLSDEDHRVHAAVLLGVVTKHLVEKRGTLCEFFTFAGDDVTQSITRLERAGMVQPSTVKWTISEEVAGAIRKVIYRRRP